jgi:hypothetical protein
LLLAVELKIVIKMTILKHFGVQINLSVIIINLLKFQLLNLLDILIILCFSLILFQSSNKKIIDWNFFFYKESIKKNLGSIPDGFKLG